MTTQKHVIVWHPYPAEKPKENKIYLVTRTDWQPAKVDLCAFCIDSFIFPGNSISAWAEVPPAYEKPKSLDMHPDAVFARAYDAGDPDAVAAAHIFD